MCAVPQVLSIMKVLGNSEKNIVLNVATEVSRLKLYGCRKLHLKSTFQKNSKLGEKKSLLWIFYNTLLFIFHANDIFFHFLPLLLFKFKESILYRCGLQRILCTYSSAQLHDCTCTQPLSPQPSPRGRYNTNITTGSKVRNPVLGSDLYWWPPPLTFSVRGQGNIFIWVS